MKRIAALRGAERCASSAAPACPTTAVVLLSGSTLTRTIGRRLSGAGPDVKPMPFVALVVLLSAAPTAAKATTRSHTDSLGSHPLAWEPGEHRSLRDRWGITGSHAW